MFISFTTIETKNEPLDGNLYFLLIYIIPSHSILVSSISIDDDDSLALLFETSIKSGKKRLTLVSTIETYQIRHPTHTCLTLPPLARFRTRPRSRPAYSIYDETNHSVIIPINSCPSSDQPHYPVVPPSNHPHIQRSIVNLTGRLSSGSEPVLANHFDLRRYPRLLVQFMTTFTPPSTYNNSSRSQTIR